mmetsp:Transcript_9980/g.24641  ORF Transcript_9980/g.24641 Transcript_9980/m.24641 type:complete len:522 (+) Transcript_9980:355-1920(+)
MAHDGLAASWKIVGREKKHVQFQLPLRFVKVTGALCACLFIIFCGGLGAVIVGGSARKAHREVQKGLQQRSEADRAWRLKAVSPVDWSAHDVMYWAETMGLEEFKDGFRQSSVDGELLLSITEDEVKNDLKITNNLLAKKLMQHVQRLRNGNGIAPNGIEGQARLRQNIAPRSGDALAGEDGTLSVYRIWESMREPSQIVIKDVGKIKSMGQLTDIVTDRLKQLGVKSGTDDLKDIGPIQSFTTREGTRIEELRLLPSKVFVLLGQELYFFPDDTIGEKMLVWLPQAERSVEVEVLSSSPRLMMVPNFLSPSECEEIVKVSQPIMKRSTVLQQGDQKKGEKSVEQSVRTSSTAWLMRNPGQIALVDQIRKRVSELVKVPEEFAEDMQVLHYEHKQHYHVHHDYFDPKLYPGDKRWEGGHNRMITVFFYLRTVERGGETVFPYGNATPEERRKVKAFGPCEMERPGAIKVPAVQGNAIIFYSMHPRGHTKGALDPNSLHGGCDPVEGEKWSANYWIRNGRVL